MRGEEEMSSAGRSRPRREKKKTAENDNQLLSLSPVVLCDVLLAQKREAVDLLRGRGQRLGGWRRGSGGSGDCRRRFGRRRRRQEMLLRACSADDCRLARGGDASAGKGRRCDAAEEGRLGSGGGCGEGRGEKDTGEWFPTIDSSLTVGGEEEKGASSL